jgi:HipA-like protein
MRDIYFRRARVGAILADDDGLRFRYDDGWRTNERRFPLSLSMPPTDIDGGPPTVTPWLSNLLPEGEPLQAVTRALGVARQDVLSLATALGRSPAAKYEHNQSGQRGPSIADMIALIREHMTARDINRFLDAVIFNIAIGNIDSHAKNYAVLLGGRRPELAPLYDLMSGLARQGITENYAQSIGGERKGRYVTGKHWRRMAEAAGLSATATLRRVSDIAGGVHEETTLAWDEVARMSGEQDSLLEAFARATQERAMQVYTNTHVDPERN